MKKMVQNQKLQTLRGVMILISLLCTILGAIKFGRLNSGYVLGASNPVSPMEVASSIVYDNGLMQIHSGYEQIILLVVLLLMLGVIYQFVTIIRRLGSDPKFGVGGILKIVMLNIAVFVLTVFGLASLNVWIIERDAPRNLSYERVTPEVVRIAWGSKNPVISQVLWGYSPDHLDNVSLGSSGEERTVDHEVILKIAPKQELYFKVIANGVKYGEAGMTGYYHLGKNSNIDEVYELRLKEAVETKVN